MEKLNIDSGLLIGLFNTFAPIAISVYREYKQSHPGIEPTDEQIQSQFLTRIDAILAEGIEFKRTHPKPTTAE